MNKSYKTHNQLSFNLDSAEFEKRIKESNDSIILDVRTQDEYNKIRIPNSILIDIYKPDFAQKIDQLDRTKSYFVYCRSGVRSLNAVMLMINMGFEYVFNLSAGIIEWEGDIEPDEK